MVMIFRVVMMGNTQYSTKAMMLKPIITALYFSTALSIHDTANHQLYQVTMPLPMDIIYHIVFYPSHLWHPSIVAKQKNIILSGS